jgi:hypothetical protein
MKKKTDEPIQHIPWGYGITRVTAMAVDPERLYAYWEITDSDLERARATLPQGADTQLILRVFDTTGRIFDGTNAHHSFDVSIQRSDRQWFLTLNRPNSTAVVEVGVRGPQGSYAAVARSKPVDFPRREPAPPSEPEWRMVQEVVESSGVRGVRLNPPPSAPASKKSPRLQQTGATSDPETRAGISSEERLRDQGRSAGGSEERLRDGQKKNGKARES